LEKLVFRIHNRGVESLEAIRESAKKWFEKNPRLCLIQVFYQDAGWALLNRDAGVECLNIGLDALDKDEWLRYKIDGQAFV